MAKNRLLPLNTGTPKGSSAGRIRSSTASVPKKRSQPQFTSQSQPSPLLQGSKHRKSLKKDNKPFKSSPIITSPTKPSEVIDLSSETAESCPADDFTAPSKATTELQRLQQENASLMARLKRADQDIKLERQEKEREKQRAVTLEAKRDEEIHQAINDKDALVKALKNEMQEAKNEVHRLKNQALESESLHAQEVRKAKAALEEQVARLNEQISKSEEIHKREYRRLKDDANKAKNDFAALKIRTEKDRDEVNANLVVVSERNRKELASMKKQWAADSQKRDDEVTDLANQLNAAKIQYEDVKHHLEKEREEHRFEWLQKEAENTAIRNQLQEAKDKIEDLEDRLENQSAQESNQVESLRSERDSSLTGLSAASQRINQLERNLKEERKNHTATQQVLFAKKVKLTFVLTAGHILIEKILQEKAAIEKEREVMATERKAMEKERSDWGKERAANFRPKTPKPSDSSPIKLVENTPPSAQPPSSIPDTPLGTALTRFQPQSPFVAPTQHSSSPVPVLEENPVPTGTSHENLRKIFIKTKRRHDSIYSICKEIAANSHGLNYVAFGDFGHALLRLSKEIEKIEWETRESSLSRDLQFRDIPEKREKVQLERGKESQKGLEREKEKELAREKELKEKEWREKEMDKDARIRAEIEELFTDGPAAERAKTPTVSVSKNASKATTANKRAREDEAMGSQRREKKHKTSKKGTSLSQMSA